MDHKNMLEKMASAMEAKRSELIAQPLGRIWDDLALAAYEAFEAHVVEEHAALMQAISEAAEQPPTEALKEMMRRPAPLSTGRTA